MNTAGNKLQEGIREILWKLIRFCGGVGHWTLELSLPPHLWTTCLFQHCTWFQCKDNVVVYLWDYPRWAWTYSCSYVLRVFYPYRWTAMRLIDFDETFYWYSTLSVIGFHSGWIKFHTFLESGSSHTTRHGVAAFIGVQGGSSQWPPLSESMNLKKTKTFYRVSFYLAQSFNTCWAQRIKIYLKYLFCCSLYFASRGGSAPLSHPSYILGFHHKVQLDFFKNIFW
jgi:hypothetical protein